MGDLPPQLGCFSRNVIIDFAIMFRYQSYQNHMKVSWNGYPPSHPFIHGDFHEIKHPASLGYPHDFGNLHFYGPGFGEASSLRPVVDSWELRTQFSSDGWNEKNYFTSCDPHHDIYTFSYWQIYLAYLLAYDLAYLLAYLLAFYLANLLSFYLAYLLALYLTYLLAFNLAFYLAYLSGISSGIFSGILSGKSFPAGPHVGRYGTKNVQKKVRKNVRKNIRRYARRYAR